MDFYIKYINNSGILAEKYIEVKPYYQLLQPQNHYSIRSKAEYIKNRLKWQATYEYCNEHNIGFDIYTEKGIVKFKNILEEYYNEDCRD